MDGGELGLDEWLDVMMGHAVTNSELRIQKTQTTKIGLSGQQAASLLGMMWWTW